MKTAFVFFLLGAIAGGFALHFYNQRTSSGPAPVTASPAGTPPASSAEPSFTDKARQTATQARDTIANKLTEWNLTPEDIKRDLAETGRVVRSKARGAGEKIDDARILTVIKAKYVLDRDLSALAISVDCTDGKVTLTGTVASHDLIGRATALALDTDGVTDVTAQLAVGPPANK